NIRCNAVAIQPDGREIIATEILDGTKLDWDLPHVLQGEVADLKSTKNSNNLGMSCDVSTRSDLATLEFPLRLTKAGGGESRTEIAQVTLPYSLGVAAGLVHHLPLYQGLTDTHASLSASKETFGFQLRSFRPNEGTFESVSICQQGEYLYFTKLGHIYRLKDGLVSLYAGAHPSGKSE